MTTRLAISVFFMHSLLAGLAMAGNDSSAWIELSNSHFTVVTNGNEKQGRRVIERFEEIRAVFHSAFPRMKVDTSAPIVIFAAKDEKSFQALEPLEFKTKGHIRIGGLFLRGAEKNLVLVRLDSGADHIYEIVFHEYAHVILNLNVRVLPLWLDEGLAEFYAGTRIQDKSVGLGLPSGRNIAILREKTPLPLDILLRVDHASPYYNEQDKGTIFYAQSWALVHYLMVQRLREGAAPLPAYLTLLDQGADPVGAAAQTFGDLAKLNDDLDTYIHRLAFQYFKMKSAVRAEDLTLSVRSLTPVESAALRGDFLAHIRRFDDARALLSEAMGQDASNALVCESLGYLELAQNHLPEAAKWFSEAARLDSRSFLAHYYHAMSIEKEGGDEEHLAEAEASLRRSAQLNVDFAPAYGALASVMARRGNNLKSALALARRAIQLEPGEQSYRLVAASIQMQLGETDAARQAVELVLANAKTPNDRAEAEAILAAIKSYQLQQQERKEFEERVRVEQAEYQKRAEEARQDKAEREKREEVEAIDKIAKVIGQAPSGQGKAGWSVGKVTSVSCKEPPGLELTLRGALMSTRLHAANYFKIEFKTSAWEAPADFNPCQHLLGHTVAISFRSFEDSPYDGEIVSVEVRK